MSAMMLPKLAVRLHGGMTPQQCVAQAQAAEQGCDQVVWLDSREHRWVEEMGGMNLCFVYGKGRTARLMRATIRNCELQCPLPNACLP